MWLGVLLAAEAWKCPPWEILRGSKVIWLMRWNFLQEQRLKKVKDGRQDRDFDHGE